jgi:hypothetical protein
MIGEEGKKMDDKLEQLVRAGAMLSNCAFNLNQWAKLAPDTKRSLEECQKRWDLALRVFREAAPSPGSAARPELEKLVHAVEVAYLNIWEAKFRGVNMDGLEEQHAKSRARLLAAYPGSAATGQPQAQAEGGAE